MNRRGNLRASDDDREQIIERLRKAATEGRIAAEELEQRVARALKARTYADLDSVVSDLPGPRRGRQPAPRTAGGWAVSTVRAHPALLLLAIPVMAVAAAMLVAATVICAMVMIVALLLGVRPRMGYRARTYARHYRRPGVRPPRRGTGSYWA